MASDHDVLSAINSFVDRLVPTAPRELVKQWGDLTSHDASTLRILIKERLERPENAKYLRPAPPAHVPGSVQALADQVRTSEGRGGSKLFGLQPVGFFLDNARIAPGTEHMYAVRQQQPSNFIPEKDPRGGGMPSIERPRPTAGSTDWTLPQNRRRRGR